MPRKHGYLKRLGVYGFESLETIILAALVTEDPLLLIGKSGTGKTFLLNSISEALGLEHRHYNASLLSFDDLVGFPFPDEERSSIKYLETPATVWGAQSILVDEISRCRPEHQNRLFSLIHERRIQGISLESLRFRWAAMNPSSPDQDGDYTGTEPLDRALADRFALIINVADWSDLSKINRKKIEDPSGDGLISNDNGKLNGALSKWRIQFNEKILNCPEAITEYACVAATSLGEARIRISPRRVRMLARSLLAATIVSGSDLDESLFHKVLKCSLPHQAWGEEPRREAVAAAHRAAWDSAVTSGNQKWIHDFHLERSLPQKVRLLIQDCPNADAGNAAVAQLLVSERPERAAVIALSLYPAAAEGRIPCIGAEGVADLGRLAQRIMSIDADIQWREHAKEENTIHPELTKNASTLHRLSGARRERANQLLTFLMVEHISPESFQELEKDLEKYIGGLLCQRTASVAWPRR